MRRTVRNMMVRDTMEGTVYPSPLMPALPIVSGFGAGYPDYPWFFGTDGAYSIFSLAAVGQWKEAKNHLATIRRISQLVNGPTGKVLHEMVTDGSIYFGTNAQNGDANETGSSPRPWPPSGAGLAIIPFGTTTTTSLRLD
jgi:hypothetical protein